MRNKKRGKGRKAEKQRKREPDVQNGKHKYSQKNSPPIGNTLNRVLPVASKA